MPLPSDLRFRAATPNDLPAIAAMREAVGWAVHDWALEAVLRGPHACCLLAVDEADAIGAIGSGMAYGRLGFVGNMIVAEEHRRRGVGSAVLEEIIGFLEGNGCTRLELFATSDGRPLYARHGFDLAGPSAMARVPRGISLPAQAAMVTEAGREAFDDLAAYDAPRFGGDRAPILEMMLTDPARPMLVARDGDGERIAGFAWVRPDATRIGPMLADSPEVAGALLRVAFERLAEAEDLTLNLPLANEPGSDWLRGLGIELDPWNGRMARGPQVPRRDETIYANAVGALG
ncbi:MAG: GNAT family N-acetyltransferase [Candidatus Limnocylindria bacterium]